MRWRGRKGCDFECKRDVEHFEDEMLETVWQLREEGESSLEKVINRADVPTPDEIVLRLAELGDIVVDDGAVRLTERGEKRARKIIRQHRLAEVLLYQVMSLDDEKAESAACQFEHMLNPEVTESICTLLGHPRMCPHGKPIPPARCCEKFRTEVQPLVQRLSDLAVGQAGRITVIAPKFRSRLERLGSFGVVPGAQIRLKQKFPSFVIEIGETTIALDKDIADEILVKLAG